MLSGLRECTGNVYRIYSFKTQIFQMNTVKHDDLMIYKVDFLEESLELLVDL